MVFEPDDLSISEIIDGVCGEEGSGKIICITCGKVFERGEIYEQDGRFFDARRAALRHQAEHGNRLGVLLNEENRYVTLTDTQRELFNQFGQGFADAEIAKCNGISTSTVRSQRFAFREKARQAKMYIALYELALSQRKFEKGELIEVSNTARMVDERYVVTLEEREKILKNTFESFEPLRLKLLSAREKKKIVILGRISEEFERGCDYTEKEVNAILQPIFDDYVLIRRYLIEYGFMDRTRDGGKYWLK